MSTILTADLHFALGHSVEYRLGILSWLGDMSEKLDIDQVLILGDLTERKDEHNAHLVEAITAGVYELAKVVEVFILRGNHDYLDPTTPFFGFLSKFPNVHFITEPAGFSLPIDKSESSVLFLPHTREVASEWEDYDFRAYDYVFVHQTFTGALAENGQEMKGSPVSVFGKAGAKIYSGDIHVPQKIGPVEYVGAPYRMRFGDAFDPRVILLRDGAKDLSFPCPNRHVVEMTGKKFSFVDGKPAKGDFVKVKVAITSGEFSGWNVVNEVIRKRCTALGWIVVSVVPMIQETELRSPADRKSKRDDPSKVLKEFCKTKTLDEKTAKTGRVLFKDFTDAS